MTAYGALISLKNTIDYVLHSSYFTLSEPSPKIILRACNKLKPLQKLLERLDETRTSRSRKKVNELDGRIKEIIWELEDKLESLLYQQILPPIPTEQEQVDGDGGMKETTTVWQFQALLESLPSEFEFQSPPPDTSNIQRRRRRRRRVVHKLKGDRLLKSRMKEQEQVDGDGGTKETTTVWQFQALLESLPSEFVPDTSNIQRSRDPLLFSIDLHCLQNDVVSFINALKHMKKEYIYELENMPQEPISTTIGLHSGQTKSKMIGFSDLFQQIKHDVKFECEKFNGIIIHLIVGAAGIGKTTLAKEVYEDADIVSLFNCRAWVTVTRTMVDEGPQFDEVVKGIRAQLCDGDTLIQGDQNIADHLKGKKCLLVLDDVWETQVFDRVEKSLPAIREGCLYILLTTRGLGLHAHRETEVRFLSEEESKDLLCHKVFGGKELCPPQLDKAATKIAKKCEGLPLMIVTVADILSKSQNIEEPAYWNDVAEERNSVFKDAYEEISEVLYPSYDYLPQYLKMPFLFMGVFPPEYETPLSKLINMLNAEGWFFQTNRNIKSLNDSVCHCLIQLCSSRYLVLSKRQSVHWYDNAPDEYKTCWLHSSWRHVCRGEARKNKFYHALHKLVDSFEEDFIGQRGLCLQNNMLFGIKEFRESVRLNCASLARSLIFYGPYQQYPVPIDVGFRLLRELDALQLRFYTFPIEILTLVLLKYLALTCNGELPSTISKLFNLRVLIVHPHMNIRRRRAPSYIPIQIWDMQELEHIEILGKSLVAPSCVASLEKLLTLVGVNASISTILELSRRIPKIRKLRVQVELTPYDDHNDLLSCFACISTLESLKILKFSIINPVIQHGYVAPVPPNSLRLPLQLKKLHLSGTGFPWEYMDSIGSLPSLQVLKLRSYAFRTSNWEALQEEMFPKLQFLLIEDSDLVGLNLSPNLRRVSIKHCYKLERIHWQLSSFKDRKIELVDCNPLAMTWVEKLEPNKGAHLDVTNSSSFEEKPKIIKFTRYWRRRW